jgi:hypothetical protein
VEQTIAHVTHDEVLLVVEAVANDAVHVLVVGGCWWVVGLTAEFLALEIFWFRKVTILATE